MALLCSETGKNIEYGSPLYASLVPGRKRFFALGEEAVSRIPQADRMARQLKSPRDGENIFRGTSTENTDGSYTITGFGIDEKQFLFSISPEVAIKHLPTHTQRVLAEAGA